MASNESDGNPGRDDLASIKRLHALVRPHRARLAYTVLALIGLAAANMSFPLMVNLLIDDIFRMRTRHCSGSSWWGSPSFT